MNISSGCSVFTELMENFKARDVSKLLIHSTLLLNWPSGRHYFTFFNDNFLGAQRLLHRYRTTTIDMDLFFTKILLSIYRKIMKKDRRLTILDLGLKNENKIILFIEEICAKKDLKPFLPGKKKETILGRSHG